MITFYYANGQTRVLKPTKAFFDGKEAQKARDLCADFGAKDFKIHRFKNKKQAKL